MDQKQLKEKYSSYENVKALFWFLYKILNWICLKFKDEKVCEILIWEADGDMEPLEKNMKKFVQINIKKKMTLSLKLINE